MQKFALAALSAAFLFAAGAASAQDYRITFGDLDLSSVEGAAAFDARVDDAAARACRGAPAMSGVRCRARFRAEALDGLPQIRRDDYARARTARILAMVPAYFG